MKSGKCPACQAELNFDSDEQAGKKQVVCPQCEHKFGINEAKKSSILTHKNLLIASIVGVIGLISLFALIAILPSPDPETNIEINDSTDSKVEGTAIAKPQATDLVISETQPPQIDATEYEVTGSVNSDTSRVTVNGQTAQLTDEEDSKTFTLLVKDLDQGENNIRIITYDKDGETSEQKTITVTVSLPTYLVTQVVDGDTLKVNMNGKTETIRLIGIDSPEKGACFFNEAKTELTNLALNKQARVELDPTQGERDKYERLLAYIWVGELNLNEVMIKGGYAKEYTYNKAYKYQSEFKKANTTSTNSNVGLFGDACGCQKGEEKSRTCSSCNIAAVTYSNWDCSTYQGTVTDTSCTSGCYVAPTPKPAPAPGSGYSCNCSKTCSQMSSCEEAYFQLRCGCGVRDGDNDGVPCESICPGG